MIFEDDKRRVQVLAGWRRAGRLSWRSLAVRDSLQAKRPERVSAGDGLRFLGVATRKHLGPRFRGDDRVGSGGWPPGWARYSALLAGLAFRRP